MSDRRSPSMPDKLSQSSAVSVAMPGFITTPQTTLQWHSDLIWIDDTQQPYPRNAQAMQKALREEFIHKGYSFVPAQHTATYEVVAVVILGDIKNHDEITQVFQLYPSRAAPSGSYTRGTLMVAIAPAGTKNIVWRGALELFSDPAMQAVEIRHQRMQWGAQQLLSSIPNQPQ